METKDIGEPSKWVPISDPVQLAALGKLAEEAGELVAIISRCIIQGVDGIDPDTGEVNRANLQKEIADVQGLSDLVVAEFKLSTDEIDVRAGLKWRMKEKWLEMLRG